MPPIKKTIPSPKKQDAHERADVLGEFARIVSSSLDIKETLRRSLKELSRVLIFDSASVYLLPREGQNEFLAGIGFDDENIIGKAAEELLSESRLINDMVRLRQPIISPDVRTLDGWIWIPGAEDVRSFMGIPLIARDVMIGALMVDSQEVNCYDETDLEMVELLAQQIAISIENARLFETVQSQLRLSETLRQVGELLTTSLSLDEVYERIFDLLGQVVNFDTVSVQILERDDKTLEMVAGRGFANIEKTRAYIGSISQNSLRKFSDNRQWKVIPNTDIDPDWVPLPDYIVPIRSWVGAILKVKDRLVGILNVDSFTTNAYDEGVGETVAAFANQAAVAIENARLHDETRRRANELDVLREVAVKTAVSVDVDELLRQTTEMIVNRVYSENFGFVLFDHKGQTLFPHNSYHGMSSEDFDLVLSYTESVVGHVAQIGQTYIVNDVNRDPYYCKADPLTRSEIAAAVVVKGEIFGVINAESSRVNAFSANDARFLETLAGQVAVAVERARLLETLQSQADILGQEVAERTTELSAERDRNLTILESAGEGIILTDVSGKILYTNPAIEHQSGYSRNELLHQNPRILQSGHTHKSAYTNLWETILRGDRWEGEIINRRKDGSLYDASLTIVPILDSEGKVNNFVSVQSDISRLKEVERLKAKFVTNVSHELRTPLTNITTYLTLLERGSKDHVGRYLKVLKSETQRLTRLIQDLLNLSQLEMEFVSDRFNSSDLMASLETNFEAFAAQADAKQIRFKLDLPPTLPHVLIERHHLGQILTNLLGNAFAYTAEGGQIELSSGVGDSINGSMAWVQIADTGVGIPDSEMPHLFERFFRGWASQGGSTPGTGLGLAICKEILDQYGGEITVESEPDVGSRFIVRLPVAD